MFGIPVSPYGGQECIDEPDGILFHCLVFPGALEAEVDKGDCPDLGTNSEDSSSDEDLGAVSKGDCRTGCETFREYCWGNLCGVRKDGTARECCHGDPYGVCTGDLVCGVDMGVDEAVCDPRVPKVVTLRARGGGLPYTFR